MMRVAEATPESFESVYPLLATMSGAISKDRWRALFDYPWETPERTRGFLLIDGEKVVGFFGTIFSTREIGGRTERICNLSTWVTLPEYRNQALRLFQTVATLPDCTITCATPLPATYSLYTRFGFQDLETALRIILPLPSLRQPTAFFRYRVERKLDRIAALLPEPEPRAFRDHRACPCGHLVVHSRSGRCYIVFTHTRGARHRFVHLHHISDRAIFLEALDVLRWHFLTVERTAFMMIDARLLAGADIPWSRTTTLARKQVVKSSTLRPEQLDNLYTELVLLGL